jgi:predicted metal-dependent phosphoesterase TrpH
MLIDMHIHTRFSPCSIIRVRQLPRKLRDAGIDGACITDHDTTAARSLLKGLTDISGLCIIVGIEYTTTQGDFLIFGPVDNIRRGMDAKTLFGWIKREGGVAIPAHPFRRSRPADPDILHFFDIIEALNGRNLASENDLCAHWIASHGNSKKRIGGSDAHTLDEIGRIVTIFDKNIYTSDDLIRELLCGQYTIRQRYS